METTSKLPFAKGTGKGIEQEVQIPWSEKYRPQTLDDIAAHNDIISTSKFWYAYSVDSCSLCCLTGPKFLFFQSVSNFCFVCRSVAVKKLVDENQLPHLLFYGPPGTGKTSTILALARQIYGSSVGSMTLELNASDDRGINIVRNEIQDFASTRTIFNNKFKLIILDECDAMTRDAQMALRRGKNVIIPVNFIYCTKFHFSLFTY